MLREEPEEAPLVLPPEDAEAREARRRGVVRPLPTTNKPEVVSPSRFDDVQAVADAFKKVQPVIINMQGVERELSRRLIDFASGLCYGLEGEMERAADQVFLLTPRGAEVSEADRRRLAEGRLRENGRLMAGLLLLALNVLFFLILAQIIISWLPPGGEFLESTRGFLRVGTEWLLGPIRRVVPPLRLGGAALDLSPLIVLIGIQIISGVIASAV
ncbi:MAG: YggT family protein [Microthrixaceae bacterium]|nr:YggT family protein [Microthrixaceae bacterium]